MLEGFTLFADWLVYGVLKMPKISQAALSFHFFIEDIIKIFVLLILMIYVIGFMRASLNMDAVRRYLSGKNRFLGYVLASLFGAVTPFCSCSSIPLFLGFTQARIPLGITMAFLITSPMVNEVAVVLLGSLLGLKFMLLYVSLGILSGIFGGWFFDFIRAEKYLLPLNDNIVSRGPFKKYGTEDLILTLSDRHMFATYELKNILRRVWKWIFLGVGLGALLHGYVPDGFISRYFGGECFWKVPAVVLIGVPLYGNIQGVIPIAQTLIEKGLPIGTAIAFMMSLSCASIPEFMMLKQVMRWRLLLIFFLLLLFLFTLCGWILNIIF